MKNDEVDDWDMELRRKVDSWGVYMWPQLARRMARKGCGGIRVGFTDRATSSVKMTSSLKPVTLSCVALGLSLASRKRACTRSKPPTAMRNNACDPARGHFASFFTKLN